MLSLLCGVCKIDTAGVSVCVTEATVPNKGGVPDALLT